MRRVRLPFLADPRDRRAAPRIEQPELLTQPAGGPVYFVEALGGRWEVFDLVAPTGRAADEPSGALVDILSACERVQPPSSRAAYRVFLYRSGVARVYAFRAFERRDFSAHAELRLQSQWEQAVTVEGFVRPPGVWER